MHRSPGQVHPARNAPDAPSQDYALRPTTDLSSPLMTARSTPTCHPPASQSVSDMSPRSTSSTTAHTDDSDTSRIRPHTDMSHPATS